MTATPVRLAYLATHPVPYQAPLLKRVAAQADIELKAFFSSDHSIKDFAAPDYDQSITWDLPLLEGYDSEFLPALGDRTRLSLLRPLSYGLAPRLRAGGFQALWVHGYARPHHIAAMAQAKRLGMTVLLRDDTTGISAPRGGPRRLAKAAVFALLTRLVDRYLAVGSLNRDYMQSLGFPREKIFLVPWAVDNARFQAQARAAAGRRAAFRAEFGLPADRPVVLFSSRLIARKRIEDLIDAFLRLDGPAKARHPILLIVGEGPARAGLEARVATAGGSGDVRFLGFRNQLELPAFYDLAELFVLPSQHEPWGLVLNEAMNAATAIVASDQVGAAADLVRDGENGFVVPVGRVDALSQALGRVLESPERAAAMGARSREIVDRWSFDEDLAGLRAALGLSPPTAAAAGPPAP